MNYQEFKTSLQLAANRLHLLQSKRSELSIKSRREISDFIASGRLDRARIRVEQIIRDDYAVESFNVIEGFCELLISRMEILQSKKNIDECLLECVSSLIWVSPRITIDVPEMKKVIKHLNKKYGSSFLKAVEKDPSNVNENLKLWLSVSPPSKILVEKYMVEIAKSYHLSYEPSLLSPDQQPTNSKDPNLNSSKIIKHGTNTDSNNQPDLDQLKQQEELLKRFENLKNS